MEHTKGKWNISSSVLIVSEDARVIANTLPLVGVPDLCIEFFEAEANARLIATAPDLLAALKGDEENCIPNVPMVLSQALLGNYEAVKTMLRELCSINAKAITKAK